MRLTQDLNRTQMLSNFVSNAQQDTKFFNYKFGTIIYLQKKILNVSTKLYKLIIFTYLLNLFPCALKMRKGAKA